CDQPFQPVASSCYYFLYYPNEWKTWGDANAYCQTLGGTLAAPYRAADLRTYLVENFSNVFWVGAKKSPTTNAFEWLHGQELAKEDWKEGQPSKSAAKFCVYMEYFSGYKAINHYCGEKFSFICEKRAEME
ncbi:UNVERIFIED_CONTAM: hypothetical protein GTU68_053295, partial [Idotea baltica]|nr:hypothetical protein [Idotea baltica]